MEKREKSPQLNPRKIKLAIIAGEISGDILGAKLMKALSTHNKQIEFQGVGGAQMMAAGLKNTIFPMHEISIIGYLEVLFKLPKILWRLRQTYLFIKRYKPDLIVTIDSPGFNFRLVKMIRKTQGKHIPIIHYVAPTVWAYKPERAAQIAPLFDHLLVILPFEKAYFDAVSLPCTYVGHPIAEDKKPNIDRDELRAKHNITPDTQLLAIAPGSRLNELRNHMPIICQALQSLMMQHNNLFFVILTFSHLKSKVEEYCKKFNLFDMVKVEVNDEAKREWLFASDLALVKAGTVSLEVSRFGIPMVIIYKLSMITAFILRRQLKIKHISLCNLILDAPVVPELIQDNFTVENVIREFNSLLEPNGEKKAAQKASFVEIMNRLQDSSEYSPSERAANKVLEYIS